MFVMYTGGTEGQWFCGRTYDPARQSIQSSRIAGENNCDAGFVMLAAAR
jgi:hypothetical protein